MNKTVLSLIIISALFTVGLTTFVASNETDFLQDSNIESSDNPEGLNLESAEQKYITYINEERAERGLDELEINQNVDKAAQDMSDLMARKDFVGHQTPSGKSPIQRIQDAGGFEGNNSCGSETQAGTGTSASENVLQTAYNKEVGTNYQNTDTYNTEDDLARGMVKLFLSSPSHKNTLLQSSFDLHGVGITVDENNKVYLSHKFCEL